MGNCCSGDHSKPEDRAELPLEDEEHEYGALHGHPSPSEAMISTSTATNTPFLRTPDTMAMESDMEKSFLLQKSLSRDHHQEKTTGSTTSSPSNEEGKPALLFNPRLIPLLEFFRHLYVRKKDLFRRVISVHGEDLVEVLKKVGQVEERIERPRTRVIQRSKSLGNGDDLKMEKFKLVKTFKPDEGQPPGAQGGAASGGTKPAGGGAK